MSIMYFLQINLDAKYTESNINHVLENFSEYGCVLLSKEEDIAIGSQFLSAEQASIKIIKAHCEGRDPYEATLLVKYKDTYGNLQFYRESNDTLTFSLFSFSCPWGKDFWYGFGVFLIDFARYTNLSLEMVKDFSLLGLEMSSDHSGEWPDIEKNCVVAVIEMGNLEELIAGSMNNVKGSLNCIIRNARQNSIIFVEDNTNQIIIPSVQRYYEIYKSGFSLYLYAKKDEVSFKIEIKRMSSGCDFVLIYPLEPHRMKEGYGSEGEKIDIAFYVQRLLELCENFAIYELKTFF